MKINKRNGLIIVPLLLCTCLIFVFFMPYFFYLPRYKSYEGTVNARSLQNSNEEICVICNNIKCDSLFSILRTSWFNRAPLLIDTYSLEYPDIVCLQEVKKNQLEYLKGHFINYDCEYEFRDEGLNSECEPILYNNIRFSRIKGGTFWLTETPNIMSKYPSARYNRICTYVALEDKVTYKRFAVMNTHLDHISYNARRFGLKVISNHISEKLNEFPVILMGDFNDNLEKTEMQDMLNIFENVSIGATNVISSKYQTTFNGFGFCSRIMDFCFTQKNMFKVNSYKVVTTKFNRDTTYSSDHYPLVVKFSTI